MTRQTVGANALFKDKHYYYDFPGLKAQSSYRFELPSNWEHGAPGAGIFLNVSYSTLNMDILAPIGKK